jgi:hypothetical protein
MTDYLVIVGTYTDSEYEKELAIDLLSNLKNEGIDVCLTTHCSKYLEELARYVKFVSYDSNNYLISASDYYKNADLLNDSNTQYKDSYIYRANQYFFIKQNGLAVTGGKHTKAVTTLLRNGVNVAYSNLYKWVIYLEYDMTTPIDGWKNLIENKINSMIIQNKKCFYYKQTQPAYEMLWPVMTICDADIFYKNEILSRADWISSVREWVKHWGMSVFEYCFEYMMKSAFDQSLILVESVEDDMELIWGKNYDVITRSHLPNAKSNYESMSVSHSVWLLPGIDKNNRLQLYLYIASDRTFEQIRELIITIDDNIVLRLDTISTRPNDVGLYEIQLKENEFQKINLKYDLLKNDIPKPYEIELNTRDIEKIYKYIGHIQFKQ